MIRLAQATCLAVPALVACNAPTLESEVQLTAATAQDDGLTPQLTLTGALVADAAARDALDDFTVRATVDGGPLAEGTMGATLSLYAGVGQGRRKITFGRERTGPVEALWEGVDLVACQETGGADEDGTCTIRFEVVVETDDAATVDVSLWLGAWGRVRKNERKALTVEATLAPVDDAR